MKLRILILVAGLLVSACGPGNDDPGSVGPGDSITTSTPATTTPDPPTTDPTTTPDDPERSRLDKARRLWAASRPESYEFEYFLGCECDGGPWRVRVETDGSSTAEHVFGGLGEAPYLSIDDIFDEIEATLDEGEVPVRVEYESELGFPRSYIWNEPELPVDGGFTVQVTSFAPDPGEVEAQRRQELDNAIARWEAAGVADYDYTFVRSCFCPEEYRGPYEVSVRGGQITAATFRGQDVLEIDLIDVDTYDDLVLTVEGLFAEVERGFSADTLNVEYDGELGYPANVFIDVSQMMADEEVGYGIEDLRR